LFKVKKTNEKKEGTQTPKERNRFCLRIERRSGNGTRQRGKEEVVAEKLSVTDPGKKPRESSSRRGDRPTRKGGGRKAKKKKKNTKMGKGEKRGHKRL